MCPARNGLFRGKRQSSSIVKVHSARTWPSCRQVTWADPEWYVPRTATDAVPPVFAVDLERATRTTRAYAPPVRL